MHQVQPGGMSPLYLGHPGVAGESGYHLQAHLFEEGLDIGEVICHIVLAEQVYGWPFRDIFG